MEEHMAVATGPANAPGSEALPPHELFVYRPGCPTEGLSDLDPSTLNASESAIQSFSHKHSQRHPNALEGL